MVTAVPGPAPIPENSTIGVNRMESSGNADVDVAWRGHVLVHAAAAGAAWAITAFAGASLVLTGTIAIRDVAVVVATSLLAFTIGVWVGAADARERDLPLRDRWLAAAAVAAVAGAFGAFANVYRAVYPDAPWQLVGMLLTIAIPGYAVGLILPLLAVLSRDLADRAGFDDEADTLSAIGTVVLGVLLGSIAGLLAAGLIILPVWSPSPALMIAAFLLLVPLIAAPAGAAASIETLIFETVTPIGHWRVTEVVYPGERQPERRLYLNDEEESGEHVRSGLPTLAYITASERWLASTTPAGAAYLFLGGGAYTLPRRIAERDQRAEITVVELDPEALRIARRFFGLRDHHGIRPVFGDARAFLDSAEDGAFDRIHVDVYGGREVLPYSLLTREAAHEMKRCLRPQGQIGINLIGNAQGLEARQLWAAIRTWKEVFPQIALYTHLGPDFPERQNFLVTLAAMDSIEFPLAAGLFDRWPEDRWPDIDGLPVFTDLTLPEQGGGAAGFGQKPQSAQNREVTQLRDAR